MMSKINELSANEILEGTWLTSYEQKIEVIWSQLIKLNLAIHALNKLLSFPFDLFETPTPQHFWKLVVNSLFETCVMIIWRIAVDTDKDVLTLQKFKKEIFLNVRDKKYLILLNSTIQDRNLHNEIRLLEPRIKKIRHNFIAHLNSLQHIDFTSSEFFQKPLELSEIEQYQKTVNEYFELLCFNKPKSLLLWEYAPDNSSNDAIDNLLVNIARNSTLINTPENNPYLWPGIRDNLTEAQIEILNKYRSKVGLSLV